jgi:hypothetical protein
MDHARSTKDKKAAEKFVTPARIDALASQIIDVEDLFTANVTVSGSFDIRGRIWASTLGKLLQALPIPSLLADHSFKVVAVNQVWGKISSAYETALDTRFGELFSPANAMKIQSIIEHVFTT